MTNKEIRIKQAEHMRLMKKEKNIFRKINRVNKIGALAQSMDNPTHVRHTQYVFPGVGKIVCEHVD